MLRDHRLNRGIVWFAIQVRDEPVEDGLVLALHLGLVGIGIAPPLLLRLRPLRTLAPALPRLVFQRRLVETIEHFRVHRDTSLHGLERPVHRLNQPAEPLLPLEQELAVLDERLASIKVRIGEDPLDLLEVESQFLEEQDLLQPLEVVFLVEPISGRAVRRRFQQPDLVVMVQRPHADPADLRYPLDRVRHVESPRRETYGLTQRESQADCPEYFQMLKIPSPGESRAATGSVPFSRSSSNATFTITSHRGSPECFQQDEIPVSASNPRL